MFDLFGVPPIQFELSFNGCNGGNDLDNCNKSCAASVSSFVRTRCVGSLVDAVFAWAGAHNEEDGGGWG